MHRATSDTSSLRFGRVLSWIGVTGSHEPIRALVRVFHHQMLPSALAVRSLRDALGDIADGIWMPTYFVNLKEATVVSLPVRLLARHAIIAPCKALLGSMVSILLPVVCSRVI